MRTINVTKLKFHLSRHLRLASRSMRIAVKDRDEPIAELVPLRTGHLSWRDRLEQQGRFRRGNQNRASRVISPLPFPVDIQAALTAVLQDSDEVR